MQNGLISHVMTISCLLHKENVKRSSKDVTESQKISNTKLRTIHDTVTQLDILHQNSSWWNWKKNSNRTELSHHLTCLS